VQLIFQWHPYGVAFFREWYYSTATWQLYSILSTGFQGAAVLSQQVITNVTGGLVLFGAGWLLFDVFNRNVDAVAGGTPRALGDVFRRGRRAIRAWRAAVIGREFRFAAGGYTAWVLKLLTYGPGAFLMMAFIERDFFGLDLEDFGSLLMILAAFVTLPLESVMLASRLFRNELKDRTWSTLYMLPWNLPAVAYSKLSGALLALVPTAVYFFLGALLCPDGLRTFVADLYDREAAVMTFVLVAQFIFMLHLVTWYSILTNSWTGILLAVLTTFGGLWLWSMCMIAPLMLQVLTPVDQEIYILLMNVLMGCIALTLSALLHWNIGTRLRRAAAAH
jgi:hypothetical protein